MATCGAGRGISRAHLAFNISPTETLKVYDGYNSLRKRLFRTITVNKFCSKDELLSAAMRAFVVTQESRNFYLLDVYANCESGEREEELQDPHPVQSLKRREGKRPAILIGLRDNEEDSGVIKVWARKLHTMPSSLTIPVSANITTEQVITEALARFRLGGEPDGEDAFQLVQVSLEAGRGEIANNYNHPLVSNLPSQLQ